MATKGHESKHEVLHDVNGKGKGDDFVVDLEGNVCTAGDCGVPLWLFWQCALKSNASSSRRGGIQRGAIALLIKPTTI